MYFVLYDRFLNAIGSTYILESWSRTQRAVDFDELKIEGEQIEYSLNPFIVVVNDPQGKLQFSGLASTPMLNKKSNKTTIFLKDYTTLWNTDIIVDWSQLNQSDLRLSQYVNFILNLWLAQTDVGFENISWSTERLSEIAWDSEIPLGKDIESVSVYTLIQDAMILYGFYCVPKLDVYTKTLTFVFYPVGINHAEIRLKDFGIDVVEKSFGDYNRAAVYTHTYEKYQQWALTENNAVTRLPSSASLIYPAKNKNFVSSYKPPDEPPTEPDKISQENSKVITALNNALYDAVMGLAQNRYQEEIDLDLQQYASVMSLESVDFSYLISVYTEDGLYKDIPVGEIQTDSKGKHIIKLGYRVQELTQEI